MALITTMTRPQRWDTPFGPDMTDADVPALLERPEIAAIDAEAFPGKVPLTGILRYDTRIVRHAEGDIVVREGDYGNSAFLILEGTLRVVVAPSLPRHLLGRQAVSKKGFFEALTQLWTNRWIPEVRDVGRYTSKGLRGDTDKREARVFLQDVPAILDKHRTAALVEGQLFGELAALGRIPRAVTVFAETDATLLEIRWQGLRELRKFDKNWRRRIDENYRKNALRAALKETSLFKDLDADALQKVADATLFETYGSFDWHTTYKRMRQKGSAADEPIIAREGDYPDGVLLVRAGFARVSYGVGKGEITLTYLGAGDVYGYDELYQSWRDEGEVSLRTTIRALGYVDVLRIPAHILEKYVFAGIDRPPEPLRPAAEGALVDNGLLEWAVDERFINGTKAMLIDMDKCVRCDDCVQACASTHGGNPRFVRHGKTFDHWMVANACMHCKDPVCMIGCPTGAIHRTVAGGTVVINDETCIGCGMCANSCPYDNIRLVEIANDKGAPLLDEDSGQPIIKATKCDLCANNPGGPACVRACPHDALQRVDFRDLAALREHV